MHAVKLLDDVLAELSGKRPPCFRSDNDWRRVCSDVLNDLGAIADDDPAAVRAGYCRYCTAGYQRAMKAANLCRHTEVTFRDGEGRVEDDNADS